MEVQEEESDQETGQPGAAAAAVRQAEAEGLTLQPSDNATGYRGVRKESSQGLAKPFEARMRRAGERVSLGYFATAEEAALAYARASEAQAEVANPKPAPLTAGEAVAQAAAEGLTLERSSNVAGYKGVGVQGSRYQAYVSRAGKQVHLGMFATAEEAALAVARFDARTDPPAAAPATAKRAAPPPRSPHAEQSRAAPGPLQADPDPEDGINVEEIEVVEEEDAEGSEDAEGAEEEEDNDNDEVMGQPGAAEAAVRQAEAEGLTLQPSDNATGYRGVYKDSYNRGAKLFYAVVRRTAAGEQVYLGRFATAEEAALAFARASEAQAQVANPKPAPLTAEEAVAKAAAEGLTLERSSNAAGYKAVYVLGSRYHANPYVKRAGKQVSLGMFATAEEAALAIARFDARTDPPPAAPAAAKRAAPPPPPPPAKQPRHTPPPRPVQPVPLPQRDTAAPQASPKLEAAAVAAPAPMIFKDKLALLKRKLEIAPGTPAIPAVAEANRQMGITPGPGESLGVQLARLLAIIS